MRRYFFIFIIIFSIIFCVVGCSSYESKNGQNIMIGETEYGSISSALASSDVGDTILVYDDVKESSVDEFNDGFEREVLDDNTYVAYEIDKPLTIKGVLKNGERPKVYGAFIIELSDKKFEDCHVTIENLEIVHDYVSLNNAVKNESFSSGVKVVNGSANIVDNFIHMSKSISDDLIVDNDLPLFYGLTMSRPKISDTDGVPFTYDVLKNAFGDYNNQKNGVFSSTFMITENYENVGKFLPSKINTQTYNYALAFYNNNENENNSMIYACDWNGESDQYNSLITNNASVVDFSKLKNENSRFLFDGDYKSDNQIVVDVYGVMIFKGDVENVVFNLMNENAKVQIEGEMIGTTRINNFNK